MKGLKKITKKDKGAREKRGRERYRKKQKRTEGIGTGKRTRKRPEEG